jgi:hypothetical protein
MLVQIAAGHATDPGIVVLTLDYAGPGQGDLARECIEFSRTRKFVPYVSTYELDRIFYYALGR